MKLGGQSVRYLPALLPGTMMLIILGEGRSARGPKTSSGGKLQTKRMALMAPRLPIEEHCRLFSL
jgi:hypothetical protein